MRDTTLAPAAATRRPRFPFQLPTRPSARLPMLRLALPAFMLVLLAGVSGCGDGSETLSERPAPGERPNILWLTSEDNSAVFIGAYGSPIARTPTLDSLARNGVLYRNALSNAPVCAVARSTLLAGMAAPSTGMQHMRGRVDVPKALEDGFFPNRMRQAGYYAVNRVKTDYNVSGEHERFWDASSRRAHYRDRPEGSPFFAVFNYTGSHESNLFLDVLQEQPVTDPDAVEVPPYHPDLPEIRRSWAHNYDRVAELDEWVDEQLRELRREGLDENTIIVYYADHGGVLPRSKRFMYHTGTAVPLLVYAPPKWRHLLPDPPGSQVDRVVSFMDLAPTLLRLAGEPSPSAYQGAAFLGERPDPAPETGFLFRDRMDERIDMKRGVYDGEYRYIRNYHPYRPNGQHLTYLFNAQSTRAWHTAWREGRTTPEQAAFWEPVGYEELYHTAEDPWEVRNLAGDPAHARRLHAMRLQTDDHMRRVRDGGFLPEDLFDRVLEDSAEGGPATLHTYFQSDRYPFSQALELADLASSGRPDWRGRLVRASREEDPVLRYWAAVGLVVRARQDEALSDRHMDALEPLLSDPVGSIRSMAAEAAYAAGMRARAMDAFDALVRRDGDMEVLFALNALSNLPLAPEEIDRLEPHVARIAQDDSRVLLGQFGYSKRIAAHLIRVWDGQPY